MDFATSIKTVLNKYADFSGRARRSEFWWWVLAVNIVGIVLRQVSGPLGFLFNLAVFVPGLAVAIRRMHDVGKSGWFILIPIYDIILWATDSVPDNEHGPNPKGAEGPPPGGFGEAPGGVPGYGPPPTA